MLDVIVTKSENTSRSYIGECLSSVRRAMSMCSFPVNLIETPGIPGNIGLAMQGGLAHGNNPFVAWVDDDDFVLPNAFICLEKHFEKKPTAIFAREIQLLANGRLRPRNVRHHLTAFSREILEDMPMEKYATHTSLDMRNYVLEHSSEDQLIDELSWVYVWRIYRSPGSILRKESNRTTEYNI